MSQYLDKDDLTNKIPVLDISEHDLISADTYNETNILARFNSIDDEGKVLLYKAAIQLAIIGYGKKNYGSVRINDQKVISLENLFNKYSVKWNESQGVKFDTDTLSARRLLRLFRAHIQKFIEKNNKPSYLWLKYSSKDQQYINICFPGGEHLVDNKNQAQYLLQTYMDLDNKQQTNFVDRLKRVYIARNIFAPLELEDVITRYKTR